MIETTQQDDEKSVHVKLSVPWDVTQEVSGTRNIFSGTGEINKNICDNFIIERTRLHEIYILETAKNKRIGLVLAFLLILSASLIVLFAPDGRETLSYWIGAALIIFAAGAAGFGRVWGKAASISFGADQDKRDLDK